MAENKQSSPKSILIFVIILFVLIASLSVVSYLSSIKNTPTIAVQPTVTPTPTPSPTPIISSIEPKPENLILNELDNVFINNLLSELPKNYIKFDTQHIESLRDKNPKNVIGIKPCEPENDNDDPTLKPNCFTILTIWKDKENESDINSYIDSNEILSWYEKAINAKLIRTKYNQQVQMVHTPVSFMCPSTGGESCLRYQFAYLLENGDIIKAQISYWSFANGVYVEKTPKDVTDIVNIYKNILLK
ncbi:MAG: hypothetical protein Q8N37_03295 [bacterium]|nr:hypothetical protein [bacterium]